MVELPAQPEAEYPFPGLEATGMASTWSRRQFCGDLLKLIAAVPVTGLAMPVLAAAAPAESDSAIHELVLANRVLAAKDVVDGYGHVSTRYPNYANRYFLARSMAPALVTDADIMNFDLDSNALGNDTRTPYLERFIHGEIYRARPDVKAIVHCHSPELIPFADTGIQLRPLYHMSAFLAAGVPIYEIRDWRATGDKSMLVHNRELGQALARVLGKSDALLMRGHGGVVVAGTLPQVVGRSVYLQINAKLQAEAMTLGKPINYLDPEEDAGGPPVSSYGRNWEIWKHEVEAGCGSR
jgi:HCOMODA/2-hydroxy-3-carboxy-muconic semialdehyde decarboxylase